MMDWSFLRRYAASGAVIAGLYLLNRFLLVLTSCRLLAWHGADTLAGGDAVPAERSAVSHPPAAGERARLPRFSCWPAAFLEVLTPLYLPRSVGDLRMSWRCGGWGVALLSSGGCGPAGAWKLNMSKRPRRE